MSDEMKTLQELQKQINEQKERQAELQEKEEAMNSRQEDLWQKSYDAFREKVLELKEYIPDSGYVEISRGPGSRVLEKNGHKWSDNFKLLKLPYYAGAMCLVRSNESVFLCYDGTSEVWPYEDLATNETIDKHASQVYEARKNLPKFCHEQNLAEKITSIIIENAQKNLDSLIKQNEELSSKLEQNEQKVDKAPENIPLKDADTSDLLAELKGREDVLFVAAYTEDTIKDRLINIGEEELAKNDEFVKSCLDAVDRNELEDRFQSWENEEYSAYDSLTDVVQSKVLDEDERNYQADMFRKEAEKCFDILEANTPWSIVNRTPELQKHGDTESYVYEIETETSFGQNVVENIWVNMNDFRDSLEQFPEREDHFAELFSDGIKEAYDEFDPSEEASLWLDETGHGKNGAPYAMKDVLKDMKEAQEMIGDAYRTLNRIYSEHEKNKNKKVTPKSMGKEFLEKYEKNLAEKINHVPFENRKFHLMAMARKDVLSFETGDVKAREKMLEEYLDGLGVRNKEFKFLDENDKSIPREEISDDEQKVENAYKSILKEKIKSIKDGAKSAVHRVNIDETLRETETKKQKSKPIGLKNVEREL